MNVKRVWSGILAAIVMTGMVPFMPTVPVYADEGTASAVSYVDIYGGLLDELAPVAVGMFSDGPDYHKYSLYDMTGDGIKELIVYHEGDYEDQIGYYVYTWDGTQVVQCQEKILRGGELRGSGTSVLEMHPAPKAWAKIVMKWDLADNVLQGDILAKSDMEDEAFPDNLPDWANATPIEFSVDMYDRSILEKESGDGVGAQAAGETAGGQVESVDISDMLEESEKLDGMQGICYHLFAHNVLMAETPDFHTDQTSLSAEEKAFLLYYYQYYFAEEDDRIQQTDIIENDKANVASKDALCAMMTELTGSADEETMNAFYGFYGIRGIEGDSVYMRSYGDFGGLPSSYLFGAYDAPGYDEKGHVVLTGDVYDWTASDYNTETNTNATPKGRYQIVLDPEGGPEALGGYRLVEMAVNGV